jgi:hypothetical protein
MFVFYCARYQPTGYVGTKRNFRRNVRRGKFKGMVAGQNGIAGGSAGGLGAMEGILKCTCFCVVDFVYTVLGILT